MQILKRLLCRFRVVLAALRRPNCDFYSSRSDRITIIRDDKLIYDGPRATAPTEIKQQAKELWDYADQTFAEMERSFKEYK